MKSLRALLLSGGYRLVEILQGAYLSYMQWLCFAFQPTAIKFQKNAAEKLTKARLLGYKH